MIEPDRRKALLRFLEEVRAKDTRQLFATPVLEGYPTLEHAYLGAIKRPMDLRTLHEMTLRGELSSEQEFADMLDLCWVNCFLFNCSPEGASFRQTAMALQSFCMTRCGYHRVPMPVQRRVFDVMWEKSILAKSYKATDMCPHGGQKGRRGRGGRPTPPPAPAVEAPPPRRAAEKRKRAQATPPPAQPPAAAAIAASLASPPVVSPPRKKRKVQRPPPPPTVLPPDALPPVVATMLAADSRTRRAATATPDLARHVAHLRTLIATDLKRASGTPAADDERTALLASLKTYNTWLQDVVVRMDAAEAETEAGAA